MVHDVTWNGDPTLPEPVSIRFGMEISFDLPSMSTAIATLYTPEGFAIAADGLRRELHTGDERSTKVQKIFSVVENHNRRVVAYSLAGAIDISDQGNTSLFNFAEEFTRAVEALKYTTAAGLAEYAQDLGRWVNARLLQAKEDGRLENYPSVPNESGLIARVVFVGYYEGSACRAELEFRHDNQALSTPYLKGMVTKPTDFKIFSGSEVISRKIFMSNDTNFWKYRTPSVRKWNIHKRKMPLLLNEASQLVVNYIQACIDNRELDPECVNIGGRIHSATITPVEGFKWVPGFEPATQI